jgi:hypothetical protein
VRKGINVGWSKMKEERVHGYIFFILFTLAGICLHVYQPAFLAEAEAVERQLAELQSEEDIKAKELKALMLEEKLNMTKTGYANGVNGTGDAYILAQTIKEGSRWRELNESQRAYIDAYLNGYETAGIYDMNNQVTTGIAQQKLNEIRSDKEVQIANSRSANYFLLGLAAGGRR